MSKFKDADKERMNRSGFAGHSNNMKWKIVKWLMQDAVDMQTNMNQDFTCNPLNPLNPVDRSFNDIGITCTEK